MAPNQPKSLVILFSLPILLAVVSLGCNLSGQLAADAPNLATPTRTPLPTFTPTPQGVGFVEVDTSHLQTGLNDAPLDGNNAPADSNADPASDGAAAQPTETPTLVVQASPTPELPTDTPTPDVPMAVVQSNMNVRGGPGTNYPVIGSAKLGDNSRILGRNNDNSWVLVEYPSTEGKGWVYGNLLQISGDLSSMPLAQAFRDELPPQPVATVESAPPPEDQPPPPPEKKYQFTPDAWHASENGGIVHFKGRIKDTHGHLINGYSVLLDNWSWKVLAHPTGASQWYPEKGAGEWDVVMPDMRSAQGWWWVSVVSYNCDFFSGFDSKCTNYTQLSEEVKVEVSSPKESIINANWLCHWDCDKGVYQRSFVKGEGYTGP